MVDREAEPRRAALQLALPRNPRYGSAACIRLVRLIGSPGRVEAELSDTFHQMRCVVRHDGHRVEAIEGAMDRFPTTACPGAIAALGELRGFPVATPLRDFYLGKRARRHCTHLLDLAILAIAHAARPIGSRLYEARVPDGEPGAYDIAVRRDGGIVHAWRVHGGVIVGPAAIAGKPLMAGFSRWADEHFEADAFEAALVLERTWYIARGRQYLTEGTDDRPISDNVANMGACYAYTDGRAQHATFTADHARNLPTLSST